MSTGSGPRENVHVGTEQAATSSSPNFGWGLEGKRRVCRQRETRIRITRKEFRKATGLDFHQTIQLAHKTGFAGEE